jgi:PiT family inorganic phosphate transporter
VVGALLWGLAHLLGGGLVGAVVVVAVLAAAAGAMYRRSRTAPVHADNVNDDWHDGTSADAPSRTAVSA